MNRGRSSHGQDQPAIGGGELALGAVCACALGAVALGAVTGEPADGPVMCPFLAVTGLPCPFCGLTRSLMALGGGDAAASVSFSPLGVIVAPLAVLLVWRVSGAVRARRALTWPAPVLGIAALVVAMSWVSQLSEGVL